MELKAGYKQSEVGVIPDDWDVKSLGTFGKFKAGNGFPLRYQGHVFGDYPFFKVSDMNNDGNALFMQNSNHWITEKVRKELGATAHPVGSIVFAKIGAAIFLERKKILVRDSCIDNNLMAFVFNSNETNWRFFHYIFLTIELGKLVSATALPSLNGRDIAALTFGIPKAPEQHAIAAALSDADALIASLDALIAKKRDIKQAAMQQLLTGNKRLPDFTGKWETRQLGEVAAIRNCKVTTFGAEAAAFCVELEQVGQNTGRIDGYSDARNRRSVKYLFQRGDVLFGRLRPYLRKFWWATREGVCSTEIWPLVPIDGRLVSGFLFQTVQTDAFIEAANSSYGTHMPRSDWKALTKFKLRLPVDPAEQTAIADVLSDMDVELRELDAQRDKVRALKLGMMQELLAGRIRLV